MGERIFLAVMYTLFSFAALLLCSAGTHWLWGLVCNAGGKSPHKVGDNYGSREVLTRKRKEVYAYLLEESPNPKKLKILFNLYTVVSLPPMICVIVGIMSVLAWVFYPIDSLDFFMTRVLGLCVVYSPIIAFIGVICGIFTGKRKL